VGIPGPRYGGADDSELAAGVLTLKLNYDVPRESDPEAPAGDLPQRIAKCVEWAANEETEWHREGVDRVRIVVIHRGELAPETTGVLELVQAAQEREGIEIAWQRLV
jgi:hypothetical protein